MNDKILVVSQLPPPVHGSTVMTLRFMDALAKAGFEARIVERTFSRTQEDVEKVTLVKILKIPFLCLRLVKAALRFRPVLCIFFITVGSGSFLVDCLLLTILRLFRLDYVLYMHGRGLARWGKEPVIPIRLLAKKTLSSALGGIVLGKSLKDDVSAYLSDDRLAVLPNGIPDIAAGSTDIGRSRRTGWGVNEHIKILFLSNLIPEKGPLEFLQMAKRVLERERDVRFILAGQARSSDFYSKLIGFIRENNLEEFVTMPGGVYGHEKQRIFQEAAIFVFPTRYENETFGIVNIEAMAWGLPVISSPLGAIPEVVINGVNGYIVAPQDIDALAERVLQLVRDSELRLAMGRNGRERFEREYSLPAYEGKVRDTIDFFMGMRSIRLQGRGPCIA